MYLWRFLIVPFKFDKKGGRRQGQWTNVIQGLKKYSSMSRTFCSPEAIGLFGLKGLKVNCPARESYSSQTTRRTFFKPCHPAKDTFIWTEPRFSPQLAWSWTRIVAWWGFKPSITFCSSYTPLFPSTKLGACF